MPLPLTRALLTYAMLLALLRCHVTPHPVSSAPSSVWTEERDREKFQQDRQAYFSVLEALMQKLQEVKRKRTRADGGFLSRHDAMNDYLQSAYANQLANDLYGPGKRK